MFAELESWKKLNAGINLLSEEQVLELLSYERWTKRRKDILLRLHARYSKLRAEREREEIFNEGKLF